MNSKFRRRPNNGQNPHPLQIAFVISAVIPLVLAFDNSMCRYRLFGRNIANTTPQCKRMVNTALNYKNIPDDENTSSTTRHKRSVKQQSKRKRKRFIQMPKSSTTEAELAHHVQTVFSGDLEEMLVEDPDCNDLEGNVDMIKRLERHPALVLNADYQPLRMLPLSVWSWQNAVKAVLGGKAVVVETYSDVVVRAVSINMPVPSVIALREYAPSGKVKPAFTRRNVFLRDGYRCQYCNGLFRTSDLSLDHVEPRCYGGKLTWDNTVTSCRKCNGRKGCLRPAQLHKVGMALQSKPRCPSLYELAATANKFVPRRVHPTWAPFLGIDMENIDTIEPFSRGGGPSLPRP